MLKSDPALPPPGPCTVGARDLAAPINTQVQEFWSERTKSTREQRQEQYSRNEDVEKALQPVKAAFETSKDSLSTLQEEDVRSHRK